jgi:single-strand DNA-binding protein
MNQYLVIGNLTRPPEYVDTDEQKFCNFTVAVNSRNDDTSFIEVVTYGKQATACRNHLTKGSQVCVRGIPLIRAYLDRDNKPRANLKVRAREIDFLSKLRPKDEAAVALVSKEEEK